MPSKEASSDSVRVSVSSAPSSSSHGSAQGDPENLGDVYVWGEVLSENSTNWAAKKYNNRRSDILLPKCLESNIVFDAQFVACGIRHAALVTKQGEVFTWGEESGGRLGHGDGKDIVQPCLVHSLAATRTDHVACGEFHTCAVTNAGELYTWGDGTHNIGLLGHGNQISHWVPKLVAGPLEGLQVARVTCGIWHTALITSSGQLFTFGDGTFGVLGHGNRENVLSPREVESLMGLKTINVACGVWHTAAVVEVIATHSNCGASSGKLFTWGDGDKYRLGQGDKEPRLEPTCVPSLIDHDFKKVACGHSLTVGLSTSGRVFTMGSAVYGQLGNAFADGKLPCLVDEKLSKESVEVIDCGSYHVVALTTKNEVYTWGKGANGRLGHGDVDDRKTPVLVEALKDKHVNHITCGSNFTVAICRHKWVSGIDQTHCSSCELAFGFTRRKRNCYNCGLIHCRSCSTRKAVKAALAPNPAKAFRVCDSCYVKLKKAQEQSRAGRTKNGTARRSVEGQDERNLDLKLAVSAPSNMELINRLDVKSLKYGRRTESLSFSLGEQSQWTSRLEDHLIRAAVKSGSQSVSHSRAISPLSRRTSPLRSVTPIPLSTGISFSKKADDNLKRTDELLTQEIQNLRAQVEGLRHRCEFQEFELQKSAKKVEEALSLAAEESARAKARKEVIESLTAQLRDMAERMSGNAYERENTRPVYQPDQSEENISRHPSYNRETMFHYDSTYSVQTPSAASLANLTRSSRATSRSNRSSSPLQSLRVANGQAEENANLMNDSHSNRALSRSRVEESESFDCENGSNGYDISSENSTSNNQIEAEWIEQYEPGVYITLVAHWDGTRELKRVRFSRRRFGEHQAEAWWSTNRDKVYRKYNIFASDKALPAQSNLPARRSDEELMPPPQAR